MLNDTQMKAVLHHTNPMLVLAGPGSGKTLVITHRIKQLIEGYGVNPFNILVITFTKAAANEMQERFNLLMDGQSLPVTFGTFHAIYFKILKYAYNYRAEHILREDQKLQYIKEIMQGLKSETFSLEIEDEAEFVRDIISEISMVKGEMIRLEHYYSKNCSEDVFKEIYSQYNRRLRKANQIDFDDMLVMCYELLTARKDILALWQDKYRYILIDEFQDINFIQYEIIKLLSRPEDNLFIVGDDDQSVYRFRGAKPEIMLNFEKDYPDCSRILLDKNFRSTKKIVDGALRVIKNNQKRFEKQIITDNEPGEDIIFTEFKDQVEENTEIINNIKKYVQAGYAYSDMAVLFRTNTGPRMLVQRLMEYNIPFRMKDIMPNIYDHWISKNIFSYIKLALGDRSRSEFLQIINKPKRYVAREIFRLPEVSFDDLYCCYADKNWMIEKIGKLEYDLKMLSKMDPTTAIRYIRNSIGYDAYLKEYAEYRRLKVEELFEVLEELSESAKIFSNFEDWFAHIEVYGEELKEQAKLRNENANSVELVTMHSSKGLEYAIVFVIDANEGITPHHKSVLEEDIEEERRLFYVALTRAKKLLHVYSIKEKYGKDIAVSRFVGEMLIDISALKPDMDVVHRKYGEGRIKKIYDGKIVIYFKKLRKELVFDAKYAISNRIIRLAEGE